MSSRSQVANGGGPRKSANGRSCKAAAGKRVRAMKPRLCRPTRARRKAAAARAAAGRTPRAPGEYSGAAPRRCSAVSPATQRSGTLSASKRRCTVGKFSRPNSTTPASSQIPRGQVEAWRVAPQGADVATDDGLALEHGDLVRGVEHPGGDEPTCAGADDRDAQETLHQARRWAGRYPPRVALECSPWRERALLVSLPTTRCRYSRRTKCPAG